MSQSNINVLRFSSDTGVLSVPFLVLDIKFGLVEMRVLKAEFHPVHRNLLVTLSSDRNLGVHEFNINEA